jgi:hypothetical protein
MLGSVATRYHRDVLACTLLALGSVTCFGSIVVSWFGYGPFVLFVSASVTVALGSWVAAMVLEDLDVSEAAVAGGLAFALALGVRQIDAREAPALWMLGPCALGAVGSALVVHAAQRCQRPQDGWIPFAAGLMTIGTSVAVLVIVAVASPGSDWRLYATLIAMAGAGGVAHALIPHLSGGQLIGGNALVVALAGFGFAIHGGVPSALMGVLLGGTIGAIIGTVGFALGFWARPKPPLEVPELARARVITDVAQR